jgi:hypothetical protein
MYSIYDAIRFTGQISVICCAQRCSGLHIHIKVTGAVKLNDVRPGTDWRLAHARKQLYGFRIIIAQICQLKNKFFLIYILQVMGQNI